MMDAKTTTTNAVSNRLECAYSPERFADPRHAGTFMMQFGGEKFDPKDRGRRL